MAKVLKDLFYGDLSLSDRSMPKDSAMHKLSTKLCECEETLEELLDGEGKEQLEALARAQWEMDCLTARPSSVTCPAVPP